MAIARTFSGGSKFLKQPGEYVVTVIEAKAGMSKTNKAMLTVAFETMDGKQVKGFFLKDQAMHIKALKELKKACGLSESAPADGLIGTSCGIAVEEQEPDATGRIFMRITGYGPANQVEMQAEAPKDDDIGF